MPDKLITKIKKLPELKRVRQKTGSYCGPAVLEMLVSNLGLELNQESLVDASGGREVIMKEGASLPSMSYGLKRLYPDLRVWKMNEAKIDDLQVLLEKGYYVAVDWQGIFYKDEYGDELWNSTNKIADWLKKIKHEPEAIGYEGHYCVVLEININKGYLRFADPYGEFATRDRFVAIGEFETRWWDDRLAMDSTGKKVRVVENRLLFVVTEKEDKIPEELGLVEI